MLVENAIAEKLQRELSPSFLTVENESHMHNVPANSETHFKVTIAADAFDGKRLLQRHRTINKVLSEELAGPVHALALHTYTPNEWEGKNQQSPDSPNCLGGGR
ncbi:BolA family protein [Agaribacter marinus]|uniref:DNA-binding transcriptional regulator BolA n=1 Tax=Agaribacter marinus TaxID=1431249 RepID=A0AA37SY58_9ALTE|nr:BolA/IbaG family iron-sulfur metabolism protein [Agaribacter marinus]GLR71212.1 transcriptional regulator [Agaribacter marinus]